MRQLRLGTMPRHKTRFKQYWKQTNKHVKRAMCDAARSKTATLQYTHMLMSYRGSLFLHFVVNILWDMEYIFKIKFRFRLRRPLCIFCNFLTHREFYLQ